MIFWRVNSPLADMLELLFKTNRSVFNSVAALKSSALRVGLGFWKKKWDADLSRRHPTFSKCDWIRLLDLIQSSYGTR